MSTSCALLDIDDGADYVAGMAVHQLGLSEERFHGILLSIYKKIVLAKQPERRLTWRVVPRSPNKVASERPLDFYEANDQRVLLLTSKGRRGKGKGMNASSSSFLSVGLTIAAIQSETGRVDKHDVEAILADHPGREDEPKSRQIGQGILHIGLPIFLAKLARTTLCCSPFW